MQVECVIPSSLALSFLSYCEVKLTSETPHPGHPCLDSFPVSSHLKVVEHCLLSPLVSVSYCSSAAHKSAALGCLLKGGSGSKVGEPCPLAPSRQMAPQGFSGCQERSLSPFTSHHPISLSNSTLVVTPCLPYSHSFSPWQLHPFSFLTLRPQAHRASPLLIILSLCRDSTPFLAVGDSSTG